MELGKARRFAEQVVSELGPMCDRIEIAGSIRRRKQEVGDIDLVILPKPGQIRAIKERCLRNGPSVMADGEVNFLMMVGNVQLDIFFARPAVEDMFAPKPSNFGSLLLCRTGSREHNIWLINQALKAGCHWLPYEGVQRDGRIVAGETERDIFREIGMDFIPPEKRER